MPRSAAKRNFGFRVDGLVRILTAADPDQVLEALLFLGIDPRPETGQDAIDTLVGLAVNHFIGWTGPLADLLDIKDAVVQLHDAAGVGDESYQTYFVKMVNMSKKVRSEMLSTSAEFEALRDGFAAQMLGAREEHPEIVWPATPGVFEEG